MTHIITSLCLRDSGCVDVCPVECIVGGTPVDQWPWYYVDPDTCIDCGACIPECPWEAIFVEDDVPDAYEAKDGQYQNMPAGNSGFDTVYDGENAQGEPVHLEHTKVLSAGDVIDLTPDIKPNYDFYESGPGYSALD